MKGGREGDEGGWEGMKGEGRGDEGGWEGDEGDPVWIKHMVHFYSFRTQCLITDGHHVCLMNS